MVEQSFGQRAPQCRVSCTGLRVTIVAAIKALVGDDAAGQPSRCMIHFTSGAGTKRHLRNGPAMTLR